MPDYSVFSVMPSSQVADLRKLAQKLELKQFDLFSEVFEDMMISEANEEDHEDHDDYQDLNDLEQDVSVLSQGIVDGDGEAGRFEDLDLAVSDEAPSPLAEDDLDYPPEPKDVQPLKGKDGKRKKFPCRVCPKTYCNRTHLTRHEQKKHNLSTIRKFVEVKCELCSLTFANNIAKMKHVRMHDLNDEENGRTVSAIGNGTKPLLNPPVIPTKDGDLPNHMGGIARKMRKGTGNFRCVVCDKVVSRKSGLENHISTFHSTQPKPFSCETCGKCFADVDSVSAHEESVHEKFDPWRYGCAICGKRVPNMTRLRVHKIVHTNDTLLTCKWCGKGFRDKRNGTKHQMKCKMAPETS